MILGMIVFIFCICGIYGYYDNNITITYIGLVLSIIEQFIGISSGQQKGCVTSWLAVMCAVGMTLAGNDFFESLALCMCYENVILFVGGIIMFIVVGSFMKKNQDDEKNSENDFEEKNNNDYDRYEEYQKLLKIIEKGSGIDDIDEAISVFYKFYSDKGITITPELTVIENVDLMKKYENLLQILEIGIGVSGIKNVQDKLSAFYNSKNLKIDTDKDNEKSKKLEDFSELEIEEFNNICTSIFNTNMTFVNKMNVLLTKYGAKRIIEENTKMFVKNSFLFSLYFININMQNNNIFDKNIRGDVNIAVLEEMSKRVEVDFKVVEEEYVKVTNIINETSNIKEFNEINSINKAAIIYIQFALMGQYDTKQLNDESFAKLLYEIGIEIQNIVKEKIRK